MSRQAHVASYTEVISDAVPDAIIPRILFDRVPTTFAGLPKQGKTYLATQLAICLATGQPFLGQATGQKRVLYCSWEVNIATLRDRMRQSCTDLGWPDPDPLFKTGAISFFAHTREGSAPMLRLGDDDDSDWETLSELRNEAEADVIILDTVSRVAHIEDKDSLAWSRFMSRQNKFCRQRGCSILSIDHTSRMRQEGPTAVSLAGAQSKATTAPVIVTLKDEGGDDPREQRWRLDISSWYGDQTGPIWYRRPLIADEFGGERPGAGCVVCEPPQQPCTKTQGRACQQHLRDYFATQTNPVLKKIVMEQANVLGFKNRTVERAFKDIGGMSTHGPREEAVWSLPSEDGEPELQANLDY